MPTMLTMPCEGTNGRYEFFSDVLGEEVWTVVRFSYEPPDESGRSESISIYSVDASRCEKVNGVTLAGKRIMRDVFYEMDLLPILSRKWIDDMEREILDAAESEYRHDRADDAACA